MSIWHAILLALIQGVTEFLPISSSAHLILTPILFGWEDQGIAFDIVTHVGSLVAVMVYFRRDLLEVTTGFLRGLCQRDFQDPGFRLGMGLLIGTLPVTAGGLLFADWVGGAGRSLWVIATTSVVFGLLLAYADRVGKRKTAISEICYRYALWIGFAQALALIPGTSRSGITITAALILGMTRVEGARFSFLLSIPVGLLVAGKDALDLWQGEAAHLGILPLMVGFGVSALSAFLVIGALLRWVTSRNFTPFVIYRVVLGLVLFAFALL